MMMMVNHHHHRGGLGPTLIHHERDGKGVQQVMHPSITCWALFLKKKAHERADGESGVLHSPTGEWAGGGPPPPPPPPPHPPPLVGSNQQLEVPKAPWEGGGGVHGDHHDLNSLDMVHIYPCGELNMGIEIPIG